MAQDVFISYSHMGKSIAEVVCDNLENAGIGCWIAPRDIAPGLDWPTAIISAIRLCRVMVLIFSVHSNASKDVSRELILASNNDLVIIPVRIDDTPPEPGKEYYLARTHWLNAGNPPTQQQINALVSAVKARLPDPGQAAPAQPAQQAQTAPQETVTPPPETAPKVAEPVSLGAGAETAPQETFQPPPETAPPMAEPVSLVAVAESAPPESVPTPPGTALPSVEPVELEAVLQPAPQDSLAPASEASSAPGKPFRRGLLKARQSLLRNRIWIGGALLILALVGGSVLAARSLASRAKPAPPTVTLLPTPTWTRTPAATNTPFPLSWTTVFAKPILAAIAGHPPDFQDDFSQLSPQWSVYSGELKINNGMLAITVDPKLGSTSNKVNNPGMHFNNFVLQLDANLQELSPCGGNDALDQFDIIWRGGEKGRMILSLLRCPQVVLQLKYCNDSNCTDFFTGFPYVGNTQLVTIMIISQGTEYGIYVNNIPVYHLKDLDRELSGDITLSLGTDGTKFPATLDIDNLKMWDLDDIPNLPSPIPGATLTRTLVPTATQTPDMTWIKGFAEPILAAVHIRPSNFQDDFSSLSPEWSIDSGKLKSVNGALAISVDPRAGQSKGIVSNPELMPIKNFVMEFDADLHGLSPCGKNNEHDEFVMYWHYTDSTVMRFSLLHCPLLLGVLSICEDAGCTTLLEVSPNIDTRTFFPITLISRGAEYAIYMNGIPITYLNDMGRPPGKQITLTLKAFAGSVVSVEIDNLKVWNLDNIPNLP